MYSSSKGVEEDERVYWEGADWWRGPHHHHHHVR